MTTLSDQIVLKLMSISLGEELPSTMPPDINWGEVTSLSCRHGVLGVCFDALEKLPIEMRPGRDETLKIYGQVCQKEAVYSLQLLNIEELAGLFASHGIRLLLLKGYGVSLEYPVPQHRASGDIDIYLYGSGKLADDLIFKEYGIRPKQNEDKHSIFTFKGSVIENHAVIINDNRYRSVRFLEEYLESEAQNALEVTVGNQKIKVPSVQMNAAFLSYHAAEHFAYGGATLRQLCDWACFIKNHSDEIDWDMVKSIATAAGYLDFLRCLNGIVKDYLVHSVTIPEWGRDRQMEERMLAAILSTKPRTEACVLRKVISFFQNAWKLKLVHNDSMFSMFWRRVKSFLIIKNKHSKTIIWDLK